MEFIDTHVHLSMDDYKNKEAVLARAQLAGVVYCVTPGLDLASSQQVIELSEKHPQVIPAIGLHPQSPDEDLEPFKALAENPRVKAIGEIGTDSRAGEWAKQEKRLRFFLDLAMATNKPALIHILGTWSETLTVLQEYPQLRGKAVIHCFTAEMVEAKKIAELGLLISVTAILARSEMEKTLAIVKDWPLDQLMLETDGPFLKWPGDSWPNEPTTVVKIAQLVADLKEISLEEVAAKTTQTAKQFFSLE